ncbi:MAG: ATP-binding protein [bacterium]
MKNSSQPNSPYLLITCGLSFSGKTTLSRQLANYLAVQRISEDEINNERGLGLQGEHIPDSKWEKTFKIALDRIGNTLEGNCTVIYDAMNHSPKERQALRTLAAERDIPIWCIFVEASKDQVLSRWKANAENNTRYHVHEQDFIRATELFQKPTAEEQGLFDRYLVYNNCDEWSKWIEHYFLA